ncbi:MAG: hypothetical protein AB7G44_08555 [Bacteroidia bacterium]
MKKTKHLHIQLFEKYLSFINNLTEEELTQIEKGENNIRFELANYSKDQSKRKIKDKQSKHPINVEEIIAKLYTMQNRNEGENYLKKQCSNKLDYENIARKLDVPFQKKDKIEKIQNKIIERTIGFRLRSEAIQG